MGSLVVSRLCAYPIKAMKGEDRSLLYFDASGPRGDRRGLVIDADSGAHLSQREFPQLALVRAVVTSQGFILIAPGLDAVVVSRVSGEPYPVTVHGNPCLGMDQGDRAAQVLSKFLDHHCRLVLLPPGNQRPVDPRFAPNGERVGYADGFPLMIMNPASVADFNDRLAQAGVEPVTMEHFRGNLEISGLEPYAEDRLIGRTLTVVRADGRDARVRIRPVKLNARCVVITVRTDPGNLESPVQTDARILRELGRYRTMMEPVTEKRGIMLGVNALVEYDSRDAYIHVGDQLLVS
jgi:uncharacterized protein YcbX